MEVNKDEALRCLDIGRRHLNSGNYTSARKFAAKSIALFPTPEAKQFLAKVEQEESSASPSTGSSSSFSGSPNPSSMPSSTKSSPNPGSSEFGSSSRPNSVPPRPRSTPVEHKPAERDYTPEQVAAVKAIRSSGGDFYKVLGVGKDATESEIKKAYRKVKKRKRIASNSAMICFMNLRRFRTVATTTRESRTTLAANRGRADQKNHMGSDNFSVWSPTTLN